MKFLKKSEGLFINAGERYKFKDILHYYKSGVEIQVIDEYDNDITKETLAIAIFGYQTLTENVAKFIPNEDLDNIIFAGGYENWNNRRLRE